VVRAVLAAVAMLATWLAITATATGGTTLLYPFTTRGFGMVL